MTAICIVAFDGFTDLDVFLPWDLLNRPKALAADQVAPWEVLLLGTEEVHCSATGLELAMHGSIDEARFAEAVLLAGGPAAKRLMYDMEYLARLGLDPDKQLVAAQCAGALVLAGLGLLQGVEVALSPEDRQSVEGLGAKPLDAPFLAEGNIATANGSLAGVALCQWLITRLSGDEALAARSMESAGAVA